MQQLDLAEDSSVSLTGCPKFPRGSSWGRWLPWDHLAHAPSPGPKHARSALDQTPVGSNPSFYPLLLGQSDRRAQEAEVPITQGPPPGQQFRRQIRPAVLSQPFQLPRAGAACALEPRSRPHHFFILIFFPRRKQLSRVYRHWEIFRGRGASS